MWRMYIKQHPSIGPWYARIERQPSWVVKAATIAALLVVVLPLLMLTLAAVLVGLCVFFLLAALLTILNLVGKLISGQYHLPSKSDKTDGRDDGRRNVRVIHRQ